jgi:hypothetical protein
MKQIRDFPDGESGEYYKQGDQEEGRFTAVLAR